MEKEGLKWERVEKERVIEVGIKGRGCMGGREGVSGG